MVQKEKKQFRDKRCFTWKEVLVVKNTIKVEGKLILYNILCDKK